MASLRAEERLYVFAIHLGDEESKRNDENCEEGADAHLKLFFRKLCHLSRVVQSYSIGMSLAYAFFVVSEVQLSAHNDRSLRHDEIEGKVRAPKVVRVPNMYQRRKIGDVLSFCVCIVWTGWDGKSANHAFLPNYSYLLYNPNKKTNSYGPDVALNRSPRQEIVSEKFVKQIQAHVPDQIRNNPRLAHRAQQSDRHDLGQELRMRHGDLAVLVTALLLVGDLVLNLDSAGARLDHASRQQVSGLLITESRIDVSDNRYHVGLKRINLLGNALHLNVVATLTGFIKGAEQATELAGIGLSQEGVKLFNQRRD